MLTGISSALPSGCNRKSPTARGPLLTEARCATCARNRQKLRKTKAANVTARPAIRYVGRDGEASMNINDKAPDFTLPDEDGKDVSLKDFRGKNVVLFFFPKADTPG